MARTRVRSERGAAMVEMVGIMFVVSVLMVGVAGRVTSTGGGSIPSTVMWGICTAFSKAPGFEGLQCGEDPAKPEEAEPSEPGRDSDEGEPDRAGDLGVPCVQQQAERQDSLAVEAFGGRVGEGGSDELTVNGDGTASLTLGQNAEAGVGAGVGGEGAKFGAKADASLVATGELQYIFNFDDEETARTHLDFRRNPVSRVVETAIPGAQTVGVVVTEGASWLGGQVVDLWSRRPSWMGGGNGEAERAAYAKTQEDLRPDAVAVTVGWKAEAEASAGAGVVEGHVGAELSMTGKATVNLNDSTEASFEGAIEGKVSAGVGVELGDADASIAALFGVGGEAGAKGAYEVVFDASGEPSKLVLTAETTLQGNAEAGFKAGSIEAPGLEGSVGGVNRTTWTLDLTDPANRAAFDRTFTIASVNVDGHTGGVAIPNLILTPDQVRGWVELGERVAADSYEANYQYRSTGVGAGASGDDVEAKVGVFGFEAGTEETGQELVSATGRDHRMDGEASPLSTCD